MVWLGFGGRHREKSVISPAYLSAWLSGLLVGCIFVCEGVVGKTLTGYKKGSPLPVHPRMPSPLVLLLSKEAVGPVVNLLQFHQVPPPLNFIKKFSHPSFSTIVVTHKMYSHNPSSRVLCWGQGRLACPHLSMRVIIPYPLSTLLYGWY